MAEAVTRIIESAGYIGLFLFGVIENYFPPIPEELVLPLSGYLASQGKLNVWGVTLAASLGATVGALGWFYIARRLGFEKFQKWVRRYGKWLTITERDLERLERWFERHGHLAVFICRLIPGLRTAVAIPAGFSGMHPLKFSLYYFAGAAVWAFALTYAGKVLGDQYDRAGDVVSYYTYAIVALTVGYYLYRLATHRGSGE